MAYMVSGNMDSGATEFQIEAAISKIFASVRLEISHMCFHPDFSKRRQRCVRILIVCACVCSGGSVDGDRRVHPDHGRDGFHEGTFCSLTH